ncbi:DUF2808 domain-containing protein [Pseudanabaena biceps]|nr:DUF2808 domain-containing protein [Pseudanabaena biceps]
MKKFDNKFLGFQNNITSRLVMVIIAFASAVVPSVALLSSPVEAVKLRDGKTYFVQLPMFLEATSTVNSTYASHATYYFEFDLPRNMGEPLQKLEILQTEGFEAIDFIGDRTVAYVQNSEQNSGQRLEIATKTEILPNQDRDRPVITVTFDPPIPANQQSKLIVGLRPVRNPRYDGVYLFGVKAFPQGDRPNPQFLGYGRLNFYSSRY